MENKKKYRVFRSSSLGYLLFDLETKETSVHPQRRGKLSFLEKKIVIGDYVFLDQDGLICEVEPRTSFLKRPRLSNVDNVYLLISAKEPDFSSYLLDKFLSMVNFSSIPASIVITKTDLLNEKELRSLKKRMKEYASIGYQVFFVDSKDKTRYDFQKLNEKLKEKTNAFVGQTGVGKSTLLNTLDSDFKRKVDALYVNSGRGRHTTKEIVLLPYQNGFLFDTPGFSSFDLEEMKTKDLAVFFPGYEKYIGQCYFTDCRHLEGSKGCKIIEEVGNKKLSGDSYRNYLKIYEEVKNNDSWEKKK